MKRIIIFCFFLLIYFKGFCCINEYLKIPGVQINSHPDGIEFSLNPPTIDHPLLENFIQVQEDDLNNGLDSLHADLVAAYLFNHEYEKALKLSQRLYAKFPRSYNVVINYAVSLELNEKYEEALIYLREAIKINKDSHYGSEWIHEKILEKIISGSQDYSKSILGYNFGTDSIPRKKEGMDFTSADLQYQLNERVYFVKDTDPLFGSLIFDFANIVLIYEIEQYKDNIDQSDNIYQSADLFGAARSFGFKHPVLDKRIKWMELQGNDIYPYNKNKSITYDHSSKLEFKTPETEIKPDIKMESLFETSGYNQALVMVGFVGVIVVVGGFIYLLAKKKKS